MSESIFQRWERLGIPYKILSEDFDSVWVTTQLNKNGRFSDSWRFAYKHYKDVTILRTCKLCGKLSTPKKVQYRSDIYGWDTDLNWKEAVFQECKCLLCMGCYNKVRPISKARDEYRLTKRFLAKLDKARLDYARNQNDR